MLRLHTPPVPLHFNSHAHVERDGCCQSTHSYNSDFNSHAHVERDTTFVKCVVWGKNFNSHAHVERDVGALFNEKEWEISTHTLTWSVTFVWDLALLDEDISTHTLTWSVTSSVNAMTTISSFQLTRSRGA